MSKKNKISASHILVMHQESQNSRSELTSEEAKKKIDDIYKEIKSGTLNLQTRLLNIQIVLLVNLVVV